MPSDSMILDAEPAIRAFVKEHFPDEAKYFGTIWVALTPILISRDLGVPTARTLRDEVAGALHLGAGAAAAFQKSLATVSVVAEATRKYAGSKPDLREVRAYLSSRLDGALALPRMADAISRLIYLIVGPQRTLPGQPPLDSADEETANGVTSPDDRPLAQVTFKTDVVTIGVEEHAVTDALRLLEYAIVKDGWIEWTEGYLIFPSWRRGNLHNERNLFRVKVAKALGELQTNCGLWVQFEPDHSKLATRWRLGPHRPPSNIPAAKEHYMAAGKHLQQARRFQKQSMHLEAEGELRAAKEELFAALETYPNLVESHLLLAECYRDRGHESVSLDEVERFIGPSYRYLCEKHQALQRVSEILGGRQDVPIRELLAMLSRELQFTEIAGAAKILHGCLAQQTAPPKPGTVEELNRILRDMAAAWDEETVNRLVQRFLDLPCVREVSPRFGGTMAVAGSLFYTEEGTIDRARVQSLARHRFDTEAEVRRYLRKTLRGIAKGTSDERSQISLPRSATRRIRRLNEIEDKLRQELGRTPSEDELKKAVMARLHWGVMDFEDALRDRQTHVVRLRG